MKNWVKKNKRIVLTVLMVIIAAGVICCGNSIIQKSYSIKMVEAAFIPLEEKYDIEIKVTDYGYESVDIECDGFSKLSEDQKKDFFKEADAIDYYNLRGVDSNVKAFKDFGDESSGIHIHSGKDVFSAEEHYSGEVELISE